MSFHLARKAVQQGKLSVSRSFRVSLPKSTTSTFKQTSFMTSQPQIQVSPVSFLTSSKKQ
jgi:hypothetical protein